MLRRPCNCIRRTEVEAELCDYLKKNNHAKLYNDCSAKRPKSKCKDAGQTVWRHDTIRLHKQSRISDVQSAFAVGHKLTTMQFSHY
jgi:hypothetical protein